MRNFERHAHRENVYRTKGERDVTWFQERSKFSLELIRATNVSGLPVARHDATSVGKVLGPSFELIESRNHAHQTPMGAIQRFQFSRFRRLN